MNDAKIMQAFQLLAVIPDAEPWRDLAEAEMKAVEAELRPGADSNDKRVSFYVAARANVQYRRIIAQSTPTYAGTVSNDAESSLAERLLRVYRAECAPLLRDDAFIFMHTEGCT